MCQKHVYLYHLEKEIRQSSDEKKYINLMKKKSI